MADRDRNPWHRFLALPNESRVKTIGVAFLVSAVSAAFVSGATVLLRPIQSANRAAEEQARIEALVENIPGIGSLLSQAGGTLSTLVVDLTSGRAADGVTPATLDAALSDPANWSALEPEADLAGLGQRPDFAQIFLLRDGSGRVSLVLLPLSGQGYGGRLDAILALRGDMNTIAGIAITGHSETPGLGARIEEASWQASFPGTELRDTAGEMRFRVARGPASGVHEVDGITGATRTGLGVTRMVRFWLGPDGYGRLLDAIDRGEF
ncbi:FMN-binding protein [Jannaschia seohaensis]|uniref:Na+-transporting NADH:ubiquinone oxidoreductase subunit C n=1 Tax=Jannaschia seohaensis TaxID=475081 RepID=A0A2Y9AV03_9RHOB|nr:FMN-binding protein [Jannaschia seohaensis]PWJ16954.1 Na+-transporting NADH:ubiquinone oxidoreductase subunit C [Jannaschia seohaensis]SSA48190.1 Na+-transporting NADH:ubiquinone oxidoreductase subunit C [Jannaschia seohaensis]